MTNLHIRGALVIVLAMVASGCSYNRFTGQEESIKAAWSEVQNQLQRRNDLIGNLVETVKGYATQEKEIFTQIAESRAKLSGATTPADQIEAANQQTAALSRLLVIAEAYPQLKSNETFQRLMDELAGTENRIAVARGRYNDQVRGYNTLRRQFPSNVTAGIFGFQEYPVFNAPPEAERVPRVDFGRPAS
jgi:LemA protein